MKETYLSSPQPCIVAGGFSNEIIFFEFEADFVEDNVRCIPMIVRFKLDACGIKLKLSEWSKMGIEERELLAGMDCSTRKDVLQYRRYLRKLVISLTGMPVTELVVETNPAWANTNKLPLMLVEKLEEFGWYLSLQQWRMLSNLQRFVLLKLCRPGHENANFPKAVKEFRLV